MRWLIRRVTRRGRGSVAYEDDIHYGDTVGIGRGANQALYVADVKVALEHARIALVAGGRYRIDSMIPAGVRVNDEIVHSTIVGAGAMLEVGSVRIQMLEPPTDFDAALEVSTIDAREQRKAVAAAALPTRLSETWLAKRLPSWLGFTVIAVLFIAMPIASHLSPGLRAVLAHVPYGPDRDSWSSGPLDEAHRFFGSECSTCHQFAFRWVRDASCIACHAATPAHADPQQFALAELGDARCAHCHRDHNDAGGLVLEDQVLCTDCHVGLADRTGGRSKLGDYGDFGTTHPEFMVNLPAWDADGVFKPVRTSLAMQPLVEKSGLKFPHDVHLDPAGIQAPNGKRKLECASCHRPDAGGATMRPVDFETMCQDCHRLDFDVREPERQVPHAKVEEIIYTLDEFYARRALEGGYADMAAPALVQQRRRPGQSLTRQEQIEVLAWARDKARDTAERLFTGRACTVCHAVSPGREIGDPWQIAPVRVAGIWFPKAAFTHAQHTTMQCEDCHKARESKASSDVLLLGIDSCRTCHAGEHAKDRVPTSCIDCHGYHESDLLDLSRMKSAQPTP